MRKPLHMIIRLSGVAACLLLIAMVIMMFSSIVLRQFGILLAGTEDVATFSMVGLAFLGLPSVYIAGMHIRVETVYARLSDPTQRHMNIFCTGLGVLVCLILVYLSAVLAWDSYRFGDTSFGLLPVPLWIPQLPIPIGLTLMSLALFDDMITLIRGGLASFQIAPENEEASHAE